jgi:hypothetical protein
MSEDKLQRKRFVEEVPSFQEQEFPLSRFCLNLLTSSERFYANLDNFEIVIFLVFVFVFLPTTTTTTA